MILYSLPYRFGTHFKKRREGRIVGGLMLSLETCSHTESKHSGGRILKTPQMKTLTKTNTTQGISSLHHIWAIYYKSFVWIESLFTTFSGDFSPGNSRQKIDHILQQGMICWQKKIISSDVST